MSTYPQLSSSLLFLHFLTPQDQDSQVSLKTVLQEDRDSIGQHVLSTTPSIHLLPYSNDRQQSFLTCDKIQRIQPFIWIFIMNINIHSLEPFSMMQSWLLCRANNNKSVLLILWIRVEPQSLFQSQCCSL